MNVLEIIEGNENLSKGFSWVVKNSDSNHLPYHNLNHLLCVVKNCYLGCKYHNLNDETTNNLLLAALFHDVNHTGGKETDDVNIIKAKESFHNFVTETGLKLDTKSVCGLIEVTQFPYVKESEDLTISESIIRDADLLQVTEYNWIQQNILGLCVEMGITMEQMLEGQMKFLKGVKFNTVWAEKQCDWDLVIKDLEKLIKLYNIV